VLILFSSNKVKALTTRRFEKHVCSVLHMGEHYVEKIM
jgi:hypothetical protein